LKFKSISAGHNHACGVTTDGAAYCWGQNALGQLGDGSKIAHEAPVPVAGNLRFTWMSAADESTCGVTTSGAVYCWGGKDAAASDVPTIVAGPK
jgi:alpha-tubulin suppressor-like RCC1 family protein